MQIFYEEWDSSRGSHMVEVEDQATQPHLANGSHNGGVPEFPMAAYQAQLRVALDLARVLEPEITRGIKAFDPSVLLKELREERDRDNLGS